MEQRTNRGTCRWHANEGNYSLLKNIQQELDHIPHHIQMNNMKIKNYKSYLLKEQDIQLLLETLEVYFLHFFTFLPFPFFQKLDKKCKSNLFALSHLSFTFLWFDVSLFMSSFSCIIKSSLLNKSAFSLFSLPLFYTHCCIHISANSTVLLAQYFIVL